jgi:hypothetical protein
MIARDGHSQDMDRKCNRRRELICSYVLSLACPLRTPGARLKGRLLFLLSLRSEATAVFARTDLPIRLSIASSLLHYFITAVMLREMAPARENGRSNYQFGMLERPRGRPHCDLPTIVGCRATIGV